MHNCFKEIKENAKICIWGSSRIAERIYEELKKQRPDTEVKFFIDSSVTGTLKGLPLYKPKQLSEHLNEIDTGIPASYSARYYLGTLMKSFGLKNVIIPNKKDFDEFCQKEKPKWDINKTAKVFKTSKDRNLFKFLAKARTNSMKYEPEIKAYYNKHYPERYNGKVALEHYFEFINKNAIKTAIDGGGLDGFTALTFIQNFPNIEKVYMFEPCYDNFKDNIIDLIIKDEKRIEIIKKGLWKEETTLEFREETQAKGGSAIVETKPDTHRPHKIIKIETVNIDNFAAERGLKIDYIKLDVENAEINVLKGAKRTLIEQRPQLAISIYHSDEHFYTIPLMLQEWLTNYEFRLGHYLGCNLDTVLYAIPKELAKS